MTAPLVAVTGATGFVGPRLVATLVRRGWRVRVLARRALPASLVDLGLQVVDGDLSSDAAVRRLVDGAHAVVHAAGLIKARRSAEFMAVNRDATARLSALAPDAFLLMLSSLAARAPHLSAYGASKRAGEQALAVRRGPWAAVRAPAVYGPGDRETLAWFRAVRAGLAPSPRVAAARLALIHVDDLAQALALALERPPPASIHEIDDGCEGGHDYAELATAAQAALGRRALRVAVPRIAMAALARLSAAASALDGRARMLGPDKVAEIFHPDWAVHDRRLAASIGFRARHDLSSGFRDTVAWYREQGWLRA